MRKTPPANISLSGFDAIFQPTVAQPKDPEDCERIVNIPLAELHPPEFHPFQIRDDAAMQRLVRSVEQYGVREPGLARPRRDGAGTSCTGYELVAGNRRKRACEIAGIPDLPVIIREMNDDEAAIAMVDSNIEQRDLLFSERAWAYRVKLEALSHRGVKSEKPGELSVEVLCAQTGEKKSQVYRLIQLTELVPALLDRVDDGKIKLSPALELSHLSRMDQTAIADCLVRFDMRPSLPKAKRLREAAVDGGLTPHIIESILTEPKKETGKPNPAYERFSGYFPEAFTDQQMEKVIIGLLEGWRKKQAG